MKINYSNQTLDTNLPVRGLDKKNAIPYASLVLAMLISLGQIPEVTNAIAQTRTKIHKTTTKPNRPQESRTEEKFQNICENSNDIALKQLLADYRKYTSAFNEEMLMHDDPFETDQTPFIQKTQGLLPAQKRYQDALEQFLRGKDMTSIKRFIVTSARKKTAAKK